MIPKDLEEFRKLMAFAAGYAEDMADDQHCMCGTCSFYQGHADQLRYLSTATPEQIMGMVGEVQSNRKLIPNAHDKGLTVSDERYFIVTPRSEDGA